MAGSYIGLYRAYRVSRVYRVYRVCRFLGFRIYRGLCRGLYAFIGLRNTRVYQGPHNRFYGAFLSCIYIYVYISRFLSFLHT